MNKMSKYGQQSTKYFKKLKKKNFSIFIDKTVTVILLKVPLLDFSSKWADPFSPTVHCER